MANKQGNNKGNLLNGTDRADIITGYLGNDLIKAKGGDDTVYGDSKYGSYDNISDNDRIYLGSGDDYGYGGKGRDTIWGDAGNDTIYGGYGDDQLHGGKGNDIIYSSVSNQMEDTNALDKVWGDAGDDQIYGSHWRDIIDAGIGNDIVMGADGSDIIRLGAGDDIGYAQDDRAAAYDEGKNTIYGGAGDDTIYGADGDDKLFGDGADDLIWDLRGNNTIDGGAGSDEIVFSRYQSSKLYGGKGEDTFSYVFDIWVSANSRMNAVKDFEIGVDKISFEREDTDDDMSNITLENYGNGVKVTYDAPYRPADVTFIVENVTVDQLTEDHFMF